MWKEQIQYCLEQDEKYLKNMTFEIQTIENNNLTKFDFQNIVFDSCTFINCDFSECCFTDCEIINCHFYDCCFARTYLKQTNIIDSIYSKGSVFIEAHMKKSNLKQCSFAYANFSNTFWEKCNVEKCNMKYAFFHNVIFKNIKLEYVNFQKADFFKTILKSIDFSNCDIQAITVSDTFQELKGMKISAEQAISVAQILEMEIL
ncbi:MAG: pentapeptide repeat-containing protein [Firmicutes bacterium]|nr:pentapeptide repeat-containing protein [Bacillota bacterium]